VRYGAAITVGFGGLIFRCSVYAVIVWILLVLVLIIHIRYIEDRELLERFGDSFREYQQRVPAIIVHPSDWGKLILYLFGKLK
jgi:protein-S-isoprenylcysteine O-methyltransferase Ste14